MTTQHDNTNMQDNDTHDAVVSDLYRNLPSETPPEFLDAKLKKAAKDAVMTPLAHPPIKRRWTSPTWLATAASIVVGTTVLLQWRAQSPDVIHEAMHASSSSPSSSHSADSTEVNRDAASQENISSTLSKAEPASSARYSPMNEEKVSPQPPVTSTRTASNSTTATQKQIESQAVITPKNNTTTQSVIHTRPAASPTSNAAKVTTHSSPVATSTISKPMTVTATERPLTNQASTQHKRDTATNTASTALSENDIARSAPLYSKKEENYAEEKVATTTPLTPAITTTSPSTAPAIASEKSFTPSSDTETASITVAESSSAVATAPATANAATSAAIAAIAASPQASSSSNTSIQTEKDAIATIAIPASAPETTTATPQSNSVTQANPGPVDSQRPVEAVMAPQAAEVLTPESDRIAIDSRPSSMPKLNTAPNDSSTTDRSAAASVASSAETFSPSTIEKNNAQIASASSARTATIEKSVEQTVTLTTSTIADKASVIFSPMIGTDATPSTTTASTEKEKANTTNSRTPLATALAPANSPTASATPTTAPLLMPLMPAVTTPSTQSSTDRTGDVSSASSATQGIVSPALMPYQLMMIKGKWQSALKSLQDLVEDGNHDYLATSTAIIDADILRALNRVPAAPSCVQSLTKLTSADKIWCSVLQASFIDAKAGRADGTVYLDNSVALPTSVAYRAKAAAVLFNQDTTTATLKQSYQIAMSKAEWLKALNTLQTIPGGLTSTTLVDRDILKTLNNTSTTPACVTYIKQLASVDKIWCAILQAQHEDRIKSPRLPNKSVWVDFKKMLPNGTQHRRKAAETLFKK